MGEAETVVDRIFAFLDASEGPVLAEVLAQEAMGLLGARGPIADKVVQAAVDGDPRFVCRADGLWYLKPPGKAKTLQEVSFFCYGLVGAVDADVYALAGRKVQLHGRETLFSVVEIDADDRGQMALASFAELAVDSVPAAFQLPTTQRTLNRLGRMVMGRSIFDSGICLFRLGRYFYPNAKLRSVEDLAAEMKIAFVADRGADGEASLQADVLLHLLGRCEKEGLNTLEAITAALYPDPIPIHFDAYAFDEQFLGDLPELPGVYIMRDREGRVIYIGKAVNLRRRVGSYFAKRSERPEKTQRILERIWSMEVETVGSELEALLLESKLIALCQPEFNTQVEVHGRDRDLGTQKNLVLVLPSAESECVELFCVVGGASFEHMRAHKDLCDWDSVGRRLRQLYFEGAVRLESQASFEILKSWIVAKQDTVNVVDMESSGTPDEALRILSEFVQQCDAEEWEKVSWRV